MIDIRLLLFLLFSHKYNKFLDILKLYSDIIFIRCDHIFISIVIQEFDSEGKRFTVGEGIGDKSIASFEE